MANLANGLPNFENPPLTEVAISVQFESLAQLEAPQVGLLWSKFRDRFPNTEQHKPLDPVIESFEQPVQPKIRFEVSTVPPVPRCWFLNKTGSELIQIQLNRFTRNWRKVEKTDEYPRYEYVRKQFAQDLESFCQFLQAENIGDFKPIQCEVSYINNIEPTQDWSSHSQLDKVLAMWNPRQVGGLLSNLESVRVASQHVIKNEDGAPFARLHISTQPAFSVADNQPLFVMNITARGEPNEQSIEGVLDFIDKGREHIVRGFKSITTTIMHDSWGLEK